MKKEITKTPDKTLSEKVAVEVEQTPPRNLIFVGRREIKNAETGLFESQFKDDAPTRISDGETVIRLPELEMQKAGFYHKDAPRLIALFPNDYKPIEGKG